MIASAQDHILSLKDGKDRFIRTVRELNHAFALSGSRDEALRIRDDVIFFQNLSAVLGKKEPGKQRSAEELDHAVRQIISRAVAPDGVIDIFATAGLPKPDISILSDPVSCRSARHAAS